MISRRPTLLLLFTCSPLIACTYDYSRFDSADGGSTATQNTGGTASSSTHDYDQGGSTSHTDHSTNAGGATDTIPPSSGGTTTITTSSVGGATSSTTAICDNPSLSDCSGSCFDLQSDEANCGTCGHVCTGNLVCVAGACGCNVTDDCGSGKAISCVDGFCNCNSTRCVADQSCVASAKITVCATL